MVSEFIGEGAAQLLGKKDETKEPIGVEKLLVQSGIWVSTKNKSRAFAFLGKERYNVSLDHSGGVKWVRTWNDLEVVHNPELSKVLGCLPQAQILFLKKPLDSAVTEIRFTNQKISLVRETPKDPWLLVGDEDLFGAEWVMGESKELQSLGADIEQVGLTVRKGNDLYLLAWPQPAKVEGSGKSAHLEVVQTEQTQPPIKVKINEDGKVISSSGGYLQLAYLFAVKPTSLRIKRSDSVFYKSENFTDFVLTRKK